MSPQKLKFHLNRIKDMLKEYPFLDSVTTQSSVYPYESSIDEYIVLIIAGEEYEIFENRELRFKDSSSMSESFMTMLLQYNLKIEEFNEQVDEIRLKILTYLKNNPALEPRTFRYFKNEVE